MTKPEAASLLETAPPSQSPEVTLSECKVAIGDMLEQVGSEEVKDWANAMFAGLVAEEVKGIPLGETGIPLLGVGEAISSTVEYFQEKFYPLDEREEELEAIKPKSASFLEEQMESLWVEADKAIGTDNFKEDLLQECAGALVYSGRDLVVGGDDPLSAGLFIADGSISLRSEVTVGVAVSLNGGIEAKTLLYYPLFSQASLFKPNRESSDWQTRARQTLYGQDISDNRSKEDRTLPIGDWRPRVTSVLRGTL